jgi:hypothetical protein
LRSLYCGHHLAKAHPLSLALHRPMSLARCHPSHVVEVPHITTRITCIESTAENDTEDSFIKIVEIGLF